MRGVWAPCMLWLAKQTVLWALMLISYMSEWPMHGELVALGLDGLGWQLAGSLGHRGGPPTI